MLHSIFAIEVALRLDAAPHTLPILRDCVTNQPAAIGLHDKWTTYRTAAQLLAQNLAFVERGCWDYFDDDVRARNDFEMWSTGMTTKEGARHSPSGVSTPYRPEPRYLTFTMAFLLLRDSPTDSAMRTLCEVPEARLWLKSTFARLLEGMGVINFASVKGDVMYLIPRDDDWGLTVEDLAHEKFGYLRFLT